MRTSRSSLTPQFSWEKAFSPILEDKEFLAKLFPPK
jgi:hypothetical protein